MPERPTAIWDIELERYYSSNAEIRRYGDIVLNCGYFESIGKIDLADQLFTVTVNRQWR